MQMPAPPRLVRSYVMVAIPCLAACGSQIDSSCLLLASEASYTVVITIRNLGNARIYVDVGTTCAERAFELADFDGTRRCSDNVGSKGRHLNWCRRMGWDSTTELS